MKAGYKTAPNYGQKPHTNSATKFQQQPQQQAVQRPNSAPRYSVNQQQQQQQQQQQPRPYFQQQQQNVPIVKPTGVVSVAVPVPVASVSQNRGPVAVNVNSTTHPKPVMAAQPPSTQGLVMARYNNVQNPVSMAPMPDHNPDILSGVSVPHKASPVPVVVAPTTTITAASGSTVKNTKKDAEDGSTGKKESTSVFQNLTNFLRGSGEEKKAAEQELNEIKNAVQNDLADSNGAFATLKQAIERLRKLLRLKSNTNIPSLIPFREDAQPNTTIVSVDRNDEKVYERIVLNVAGRVADPVTVSDIRNLVKGILSASTEFCSINYAVQLNPIVVQTRELGQKRKWAKSTIELVITQVWEAFIYEAYLKKGGVPAFYSFLKTHLIQTEYFWLLRKDGVSAKLPQWADYQTELLKSRNAAIEAAAAAAAAEAAEQQQTTTSSDSL